MKQQKFSTPISMKCNKQQFDSIKQKLIDIGCDVDTRLISSFETHPYLVNNGYATTGNVYNTLERAKEVSGRMCFEEWNEDLFLALSAMREGDKFHKGEWILVEADGDILGLNNNQYVPEFVCFNGENGVIGWNWAGERTADFDYQTILNQGRKATVEEIINRFTKKEYVTDPAQSERIEVKNGFNAEEIVKKGGGTISFHEDRRQLGKREFYFIDDLEKQSTQNEGFIKDMARIYFGTSGAYMPSHQIKVIKEKGEIVGVRVDIDTVQPSEAEYEEHS